MYFDELPSTEDTDGPVFPKSKVLLTLIFSASCSLLKHQLIIYYNLINIEN